MRIIICLILRCLSVYWLDSFLLETVLLEWRRSLEAFPISKIVRSGSLLKYRADIDSANFRNVD